ncbi:MAG TPA: septal ring lytic transglycosylase RlpA family protein [Candidatus Binatus sp.]|nr:septal ring lytic transglycosylase RlpA family protein [Candidatus Binatus sp.]
MRPPRVVACAALIAVLASVAVTGLAGSRSLSREPPVDPGRFTTVDLQSLGGTATWTPTPTFDPANDARAGAAPGGLVVEPPGPTPIAPARPHIVAPAASPIVVTVPSPVTVSSQVAVSPDAWHHDPEESWYGPGFYGRRTACGQDLTQTLLGVASRTLPCGTLVEFRNPRNGRVITVPVVDRGPYVAGRQWDLTAAACAAIGHCWTGPLDWRFP